jgi:hypothetical protein
LGSGGKVLKRYILDIYLPGNSGDDIACHMESDDPFLPIQKGDLINPRTWNPHYFSNLRSDVGENPYGIVLRVTGTEHYIIQQEDESMSNHRICIFTEAVSDVAENRP